MSSPEVLIVPTGTANTASVLAAFRRLGARPRLCEAPEEIARAERVVVPGVGSFGAAVQRLRELEIMEVLRNRIQSGEPTLAICLGMQLFCASSEESPGVNGLGVVQATIERFPAGRPVPQLGWNQVAPVRSDLIQPGYAYFANTYRLGTLPDGWAGACTIYGERFVSAIERGPVLGCQFHPELSGPWGAELLANWMRAGEGVN